MKIKFNAPVILGFSLICTIVFILNLLTGNSFMGLFSVGASVNWSNPFSILSLVTHIFGHISWDHLIGNLSFILLLGPIAEEKYGSSNMAVMILMTGLITGLLNVFFFDTGLLGASGIVFMLILLVSFTNVNGGEIPVSFILVALLYVGREVMQSIRADQVSQFAHIIGGLCGSFFGYGRRR